MRPFGDFSLVDVTALSSLHRFNTVDWVTWHVWSARNLHHLLRPPCVADADIIFLPCGFVLSSSSFFFSSPNLSCRRLDVYHTWHTWFGLCANLRCRSETCCTWLAANTGCKVIKKLRSGHHHTTSRAISLQLRHVSTIGKKTC